MKEYIIESFKNKKFLIAKVLLLFLFIFVFTGSDLLVKDIVEKNLRGKPDIVVIKDFWHFHYVQNDDIGFSLLSHIASSSKLKVFLLLHILGIILAFGFYIDMKKVTLKKLGIIILFSELSVIIIFLFLVGFSKFYYDASVKAKWIFLVCLQGFGALSVACVYVLFINKWKYAIPLALIISGALGNVLDRAIRGYVVDFVMWTFKFIPLDIFNPWPIFNLADVYTVIGAILLFAVFILFSDKKEKETEELILEQVNSDPYLAEKVTEESSSFQIDVEPATEESDNTEKKDS